MDTFAIALGMLRRRRDLGLITAYIRLDLDSLEVTP